MKRFWGWRLLVFVVVIMLAAVSSRSQEAWMTKNVDQWTTVDIDTVLNRSAWVITKVVRLSLQTDKADANALNANAAQMKQNGNAGNTVPTVDFIYTLRLRSALPIRLALMRQLQIDSDYDNLSKEQRSALNVKLMGMYNCPACADNYVLTLSSKSKDVAGTDALFNYLNGAKLEDLSRFIYLMNEQGEKRDLIHFTPPKAPGGEATFFFKRLDERGRPLVTPASKEIIFRFADKVNGTTTNFIIDVSKLIIGGKVIF